ncbi:hypothetical protein QQ045_000629 [Rhodiola kirilowii]
MVAQKVSVQEMKRSEKLEKETKTIIQEKEKLLAKSIPEQNPKKPTVPKTTSVKDPVKKIAQEGEGTPVMKGARVRMVALKKLPVKEKFRILKRRVVVSESDDEESEEREVVEDSEGSVAEEQTSSPAECVADSAKDVVEEPIAEDEAHSQHESDEVDESLEELFDAVEDYVEEEFAAKAADEEMEALSEDSADESIKLSDLVKDFQKDIPLITEKKASKKRKASAPTPVEKSVEAGAFGQEKDVSPAVKKAKTSSPTGKVKEKGKKVQFESKVVVEGVWFVSEEQAKKWKFVQKRKIVAERVLEADKYVAKEIVSLIKKLDLWPSVSMAKPFAANLVREVIANLQEGFADIESASFGMASVRGKKVVITPDGINDYFGIEAGALNIGESLNWHKIATALTGGIRLRWFTMSFSVKNLYTKHSFLHSIAVHNWLPSNHHTTLGRPMGAFLKALRARKKIDLGRLIFDQIAGHASSVKVNHPIGFPSLIHQLVVAQH